MFLLFSPPKVTSRWFKLAQEAVFTWRHSCEVLGHVSGGWVTMNWVVANESIFPQSG